jgi:hypothetical protein
MVPFVSQQESGMEKQINNTQESETRLLADEELDAVAGGERAIVAQFLGLTIWATAGAHGVSYSGGK